MVVFRAPEQSCNGTGVAVGLTVTDGVPVPVADGAFFCVLELLDTLHWKVALCDVSGASEMVSDV